MKQVDEMPTSGQFVAVWSYGEKIWSEVYMWKDGDIYAYGNNEGLCITTLKNSYKHFKAKYFIAD